MTSLLFVATSCQKESNNSSSDNSSEKNTTPQPISQPQDTKSMNQTNKQLGKHQMTSKQLAIRKNVKETVTRPDGLYSLVAVVEGEEANAKLTNALQVISNQQQTLQALHTELAKLPLESQQQRELYAGRINQAESSLKQNLQYMAQAYAYSTQHTYILVPEKVSLIGASEDGKSVEIHKFEDSESYLKFQDTRANYLGRLNEVLNEWKTKELEARKAKKEEAAKDEEKKEESTPEDTSLTLDAETLAKLKKDDEVLESYKTLLEADYKFNPDNNHQIRFIKSSLYVKSKAR